MTGSSKEIKRRGLKRIYPFHLQREDKEFEYFFYPRVSGSCEGGWENITVMPQPQKGRGGPVLIFLLTTDHKFVAAMARKLSELGKRARGISTSEELWAKVRKTPPDIIILDNGCPRFDAIEILKTLHDQKYEGQTIVLGEKEDDPLLPEAARLGAIQIVGRPLAVERVMGAIRIAQEHLEADRHTSSAG